MPSTAEQKPHKNASTLREYLHPIASSHIFLYLSISRNNCGTCGKHCLLPICPCHSNSLHGKNSTLGRYLILNIIDSVLFWRITSLSLSWWLAKVLQTSSSLSTSLLQKKLSLSMLICLSCEWDLDLCLTSLLPPPFPHHNAWCIRQLFVSEFQDSFLC